MPPKTAYNGLCTICGNRQDFDLSPKTDSNYGSPCENCGRGFEDRLVAQVILSNFGKGLTVSLSSMIRRIRAEGEALRVLDLVQGRRAFFDFTNLEACEAVRLYPEEVIGTSSLTPKKILNSEIDLETASFDLVITRNALPAISDDRAIMSEFYRILKPGGTLIASVPMQWPYPKETTKVDPPIPGRPGLLRRYGLDLSDALSNVGFSVSLRRPGFFLGSARRLPIIEATKL